MVDYRMSEKGKAEESPLGTIKHFSWWIFYGLFLLVILFLLFLIIRSLTGGALGRIANFGQLIYIVGLLIAVLGLMGLCMGYIIRMMRYRIKVNRGGQTEKN